LQSLDIKLTLPEPLKTWENIQMKTIHTIAFIIVATLALLVTACGAAEEANTLAEPTAPPRTVETDQGQSFQRPGQGPGFQGQGRTGFMNIIGEATGLDMATIREQSADGATLAEIIAANGGDVEAVKAELIAALGDSPIQQEQDIEQLVSNLLNNPLPDGGFQGGPGGFQGGRGEGAPGSDEASAPISAPMLEASNPAATMFQIVPGDSEARFLIDEVLLGEPITAVGRTDQVAGSIAVDPSDPASAEVGVVRVNARTLATDNQRRNQAVGRFILQTAQFEYIDFAPTAVDGLPDSVNVGEPFTFQITGDLTIRDITNEATFEATVTPVSETRLEGAATATIQRGGYNLVIPNVPNVADVSEDVRLEIDFVATAI
jgi:polyisoprenoid-binding protein YceI